MFSHFTNTASFFSVLMASLIFSLSLAGVAWAQGNTSLGTDALQSNTTGSFNTAIGFQTLFSNTTGSLNTANGVNALLATPLAAPTWPADTRHSLATPRDTSTPPLESICAVILAFWTIHRLVLYQITARKSQPVTD
jgi:hypothetical protein